LQQQPFLLQSTGGWKKDMPKLLVGRSVLLSFLQYHDTFGGMTLEGTETKINCAVYCFCTAHPCVRHTDRYRDHARPTCCWFLEEAVSPQVTISHPPGGRLPLLSARPTVTFPAAQHYRPLAGTMLYCLVTEAHRC